MRYDEITSGPYFLGSNKPLAGIVRGGAVDAHLLDPEIEGHLEARRYANCLARPHTLLLQSRPNGQYDYWYKVSSLEDDVERYHTGWLMLLADADPSQPGITSFNAEAFWKGLQCPDRQSDPWELRTSAVQVIERIGGSTNDSRTAITY